MPPASAPQHRLGAKSPRRVDAAVRWSGHLQTDRPDVEPGGETHFVCIETTSVTPIHLAGDSTWTGRQRLTVR